jgi:riboflavin synthase
MFTGIIEQCGRVSATESGGAMLSVEGSVLDELTVGASVAVNGVCLTAVEVGDSRARFDVIPETLSRTNLGQLRIGDQVNLELPMRADARFDGHIVQGHVDGVGSISALDRGDDGAVSMTIDTDLLDEIVEKGSITIDGVSLTVTDVGPGWFRVALIPHTLEVTTLGALSIGDKVNLETDVVAKYVRRILERVR